MPQGSATTRRITTDALQGEVILVTGGAQGIGAAIAEVACEQGASVSICDIDAERVQATAAALTARGFRALGVVADVTDEAAVAVRY